jgi:hypothetical protein
MPQRLGYQTLDISLFLQALEVLAIGSIWSIQTILPCIHLWCINEPCKVIGASSALWRTLALLECYFHWKCCRRLSRPQRIQESQEGVALVSPTKYDNWSFPQARDNYS